MQTERRGSPRIRTYQPVRLQPIHSQRSMDTLTKDVSRYGLRCLSEQIFPVSTEISIELTTADGLLAVRGKSAWFQMIPHSDQVEVGIAFTDLSPNTIRRLSVYLDRLAQKAISSTTT